MTYISLYRNSENERSDIVYVGQNRHTAEKKLFEAYKRCYKDFADDFDASSNPKYQTLAAFVSEAVSAVHSAYIQCVDYHIDFELHCCNEN